MSDRCSRSRWWIFVVVACVSTVVIDGSSAPDALADPTSPMVTRSPSLAGRGNARQARPHAVYAELLGKGGLWGLGYDFQLLRHVAIGGVASTYTVGSREQVFTLSPYLTGYLAGAARHRWFMQLGPQIIHLRRPSPVPEWPGTSSTGLGGELSTGYEFRGSALFRVFVMGAVGKGGAAPWLGMSLGFTL
ncbi:MAG: hypothetical protein IT370_37045 [Deltaproteobacteria bacterium]|nr:hypothetical protein [Deltaproteobacteria bacterium]